MCFTQPLGKATGKAAVEDVEHVGFSSDGDFLVCERIITRPVRRWIGEWESTDSSLRPAGWTSTTVLTVDVECWELVSLSSPVLTVDEIAWLSSIRRWLMDFKFSNEALAETSLLEHLPLSSSDRIRSKMANPRLRVCCSWVRCVLAAVGGGGGLVLTVVDSVTLPVSSLSLKIALSRQHQSAAPSSNCSTASKARS